MTRKAILFLALLIAVASCDGGRGESTAPDTAPPTSASSVVPATSATTSTQAATSSPAVDAFGADRTQMVDLQIVNRLIEDEATVAAMRTVLRHEFVPAAYLEQAYDDHPLPIGHGQTISQPYIVALMTEALTVRPGDRVLEIGTGSGYQAAVLAEMGVEVYTIEIVEELAAAADERLRRLGYDVATLEADGYDGWDEHAPFDAIIVTAAPDHLPQPLVEQLAPGGRIVVPIGPQGAVQTLWRFEMDGEGELVGENLGGVFFVPFTRAGE